MEKIKIILVDDHDIVMDGIASLLCDAPHLKVVGKASSGIAAETMVKQLHPDIIITDVSMGEVWGLELTKRIASKFPLVKVIVLTMHDSVRYISSLLEAGAHGYLLKSVRQDELFAAINQVWKGHQYIQQSLAASYVRALGALEAAQKKSKLSPREIEIIRLIVEEKTTAEISRELFLSEHTVETHRKNIGRKTGVKTPIGLINYAREHGLL